MTTLATRVSVRLRTARAQQWLAIWAVILLVSGQGFRYWWGLPLYGVASMVTIGAIAIAFAPHVRRIRVPVAVAAFVALGGLSVWWSATPLVTMAAAVVMVTVTFMAVAATAALTVRTMLKVLYRAFQISVMGGLGFELWVAVVVGGPLAPASSDIAAMAPEGGPQGVSVWSQGLIFEGGPIQGFVGNRNPFGWIALTAAILAAAMWWTRQTGRWDAVSTASSAVLVHLLTQSATVALAAVAVAFVLGAGALVRAVPAHLKRQVGVGARVAGVAVAGIALLMREQIFEALGRGDDATNRLPIWEHVIGLSVQTPQGHGYVGYWPIWEQPYASVVERSGVLVTHAHNAFVDAAFQLGLVGLGLLLIIAVVPLAASWRVVERSHHTDTAVPLVWLMLAVSMLVVAMSESRMLVEGGWYLTVVLFALRPRILEGRMSWPGGRVALRAPRNVRAPQGTVVANSHPG